MIWRRSLLLLVLGVGVPLASCSTGDRIIPTAGVSGDISSVADTNPVFLSKDIAEDQAEGTDAEDSTSEVGWSPSSGPGVVFDPAVIQDIPSLELAWFQNESGPQLVGTKSIYRLVFDFTSQIAFGAPWRHRAHLYIPDGLHLKTTHDLAVVQQGELPSSDDRAHEFRKQYGQEIASAFGLPVLVVGSLPPVELVIPATQVGSSEFAECFDIPLSEALFLRCGFHLVQEEKTLEYSPFLPVARVFLRAVVAAEAVVAQAGQVRPEMLFTELDPEHLIFAGEGLAGIGAKMALVSDPRAAGAMAVGAELADLENLATLMSEVWTSDGAWLSASDLSGSLSSIWGQTHADIFDPTRFSEVLLGKRLALGTGTNDPRFPLGAVQLSANILPSEQIVLYLENTSEGIEDLRYLGLWRALLDRVINETPPPKASVSMDDSGQYLKIRATVIGCQALENTCFDVRGYRVNYHTTLVDHDYRDAVWVEVPMTRDTQEINGAGWYGLLDPTSIPESNLFFVLITDMVDNQLRYTSSGLTFLGDPYPWPAGGAK